MDPSAALSAELAAIYGPFVNMINACEWRGLPLRERRWVMGGQVCVAAGWRRRGLCHRLYAAQAAALGGAHVEAVEVIVTAIDLGNVPSLAAHLAVGFVEIGRFGAEARPSVHHGATGDAAEQGWSIIALPTTAFRRGALGSPEGRTAS